MQGHLVLLKNFSFNFAAPQATSAANFQHDTSQASTHPEEEIYVIDIAKIRTLEFSAIVIEFKRCPT